MAEPPAEFEREHGCTEAEWLRCLPGAAGPNALTLPAPGRAQVALVGGGELALEWSALPERQIALMRMPRMRVRYAFSADVSPQAREAFMRHFDLYTRRGGG
ncbi:hypothetical protein [Ideonella sp.]|uniref:hypothetical protein n=1 Tax=Ideonella sp. TaxID=1929293 RepID=UPI002B4A5469|nr:hypothetical protein [Ideonella sp.]HJV67714.1 hypothetical protein [Ideonella sp.]